MHLGDIPRRNSLRYPEKTALVFGGKSLTWLQVNQRVNALVHTLRGKGLNKGDRIGILMQNRSQYWEIYWALGKAGLIAVPLSYRLKPSELEQLVNHSEITVLIAGEECTWKPTVLTNLLPIAARKTILTDILCAPGSCGSGGNWST